MGTREGQRLIRPVDAAAVPVRNNMVRPVSLGDSTAEKILGMQKTVGNQAVKHMASTCPSFPSACPTGGACHACPVRVQPKLTIGKPGDKYEQEADRVAEQVMNIPEPRIRRQVEPEEEKEEIQAKPIAEQITALVQRQEEEPEEEKREPEEEPIQAKPEDYTRLQRQAEEEEEEEPIQTKQIAEHIMLKPDSTCASCEEEEEPIKTKPVAEQITPLIQRQVEPEEEEEEEEEPIQTKKAGGQTPLISSSLHSRINSLKGGGQSLPESTRKYFEPRFGSSFNNVRVHNNSQAANIAYSINAKAFTTGRDVVFGAGQYSPETSGGKRLLAHELTHVVQQNGSRIPDNTIYRAVSFRSSCKPNVHGAPSAPLKALRWIDAKAQIMTLNCMSALFEEAKHAQFKSGGARYVPTNVHTLYRRWFGLPTRTRNGRWKSRFRRRTFPTQVEAVAHELNAFSGRYHSLHNGLKKSIRYFCPGTGRFTIPTCKRTNCKATDGAITCFGQRRIAICPGFWNRKLFSNDIARASGIAHEASHIYLNTKDSGHRTRGQRSRNAYCIHGFINELHGNSVTYPKECRKLP